MSIVEKIAVKFAVKFIKTRVNVWTQNDPEVKEFITNLYTKSIPEFMEYGTEKLAKKDLGDTTYVQMIKELIKPMNDGTEEIINKFIDSADPRNE